MSSMEITSFEFHSRRFYDKAQQKSGKILFKTKIDRLPYCLPIGIWRLLVFIVINFQKIVSDEMRHKRGQLPKEDGPDILNLFGVLTSIDSVIESWQKNQEMIGRSRLWKRARQNKAA